MKDFWECRDCHEYKEHYALGICSECYAKYIEDFKNGVKGLYGMDDIKTTMHENKECSLSLGVVFCEKLLIDYFRNTTAMVNGNTGFDFVLDDGSKVDSKCSSLHGDERSWYWTFNIKQNQKADYFCCVGIDNNDDRNVMTAWLIPSNIVSKTGVKIKDMGGIQIKRNDNYFEEYKLNLGNNDVEMMVSC